MTPNTKRNWLTALAALSLAACTAEVLEPGAEVGQLELPLVSAAANGTQFMLGATFDLVGPETMQAVADPADPTWSDDAVVLSPRVGDYTLTISSWQIWQLLTDANGTVIGSTGVPGAQLLSGAAVPVTIIHNQTTYVLYQFSVPGSGVINFARGTLSIDFNVQQGLPDGAACTSDIECSSLVCAAGGTCAPASCSDGVQNGTETSPDCGPACACGGGGMACNAAQAASCADPAQCSVDAAGMVICGGGGYTLCDAAQAAASCAPGETCVIDANGMVGCLPPTGGGVGSACDPMANPPTCAAGLTCTQDAATGTFSCQMAPPPADPNLACIKINEFATQGPGGSNDEFVELYNGCAADVSLAGARLVYRSAAGVNNVNQHNFTSGPTMPSQSYLVMATGTFTGGNFTVSLSGGFALAGGGLALLHPDGSVLDSVGYGTATNAFIEGSVAPAASMAGRSLSRVPNGSDTNDNAVDFADRPITPGAAN